MALSPPARCARPGCASGLTRFWGELVFRPQWGKPTVVPGRFAVSVELVPGNFCYHEKYENTRTFFVILQSEERGRMIAVFKNALPLMIVRTLISGSVCFHRLRKILGKGVERSRGMNRIGWRYESIRARYLAVLRWYRIESLRSAATRRHTSRTSVVSSSANLEKTGCITVKSQNKWLVFQCTVNWARARLNSAFIAVGAQASRGVSSVGVIK